MFVSYKTSGENVRVKDLVKGNFAIIFMENGFASLFNDFD